jgi:hypothetical protein
LRQAGEIAEAKLATGVAILLRRRYTRKMVFVAEVASERGIGHYGGIGTRFALKCGAHRGGLAPVTGKITRRTG